VARVVALVGDLMLSSRVTTSLGAAGHEVSTAGAPSADALRGAEAIVADLDAVAPEELADAPAPVIGFYQHTDVDTKKRADDAGLAFAVPRSRMVRELPELVERALAGAGSG
jgi:hypothetical protein